MRFEDDIQAFRRGELDLDSLVSRVNTYVQGSKTAAAEVQEQLDQAHEEKLITGSDYTVLTQFLTATLAPRDASGDAEKPAGDQDISLTRLATSAQNPSGDADQTTTVAVGSRLRDRFILDEVIGAGGMGTVYRGRDALKLEAQDRNPYVAIKILNETFKQRPDAFIALQREASRQQGLAHPNIATVFDFDRSGGVMFITMEYLDGETLDHFIKEEVRPKGGLKLTEILPILRAICSALSHAHARNIVHADFKPGNCFITQSKQVKVLDFGIARAMKDPARVGGEETLFDPRSIGALTPAYASPEMLEDSAGADPRDDIYALACVTYELLTGKHPFHRIPGDQAKANGLKPARIKHLSRRQNDVLGRALAFDRADRTASVQEFLDGLQRASVSSGLLKPALALAAGGLVIAAVLVLPGILDRWEGDALLEEIRSSVNGRTAAALAQLDTLSGDRRLRVLQEGRAGILGYFERTFEDRMAHPDPEVDYPGTEELLTRATSLYPDSAALGALANRFKQRRQSYLSEIAKDFERYLAPEFLVPTAQTDDLHDLIARLAAVDPANPLLVDSRIAGVYAVAVEAALAADDYALGRQYLDAGMELAPLDATLADLSDRLEAAEQRLERDQTIARLTAELQAKAAAAAGLDDVEAMRPVIAELVSLDADNAAIAAAGSELAVRFGEEVEAVRRANDLPTVEAYLARATPLWNALGQPDVVAAVEQRRKALIEHRQGLVELARQTMKLPDMRTQDGREVSELIAAVRAVSPGDSPPQMLQTELVQEIRRRARQQIESAAWPAARAELARLGGLPLTAEQRESVAQDLVQVDALEQRAIAQAEVSARLVEAERGAERERQERERLNRLAQERAARIATAAQRVEQALSRFDLDRPVASIREVQSRINELESLDASHAVIAQARARLDSAVEQAARRQPDPAAALELIASAQSVLGDTPGLARLESSFETQRAREQATERRAAASAAEARLRRALQQKMALADQATRNEAEEALTELAALVQDDPGRLQSARRQYVEALLLTTTTLVEEKRFSVAERVIETAARHTATGDTQVAAARAALVTARDEFREERARKEARAGIEALAQRFSLEVNSGQLTRARQTLEEYRKLAPDSPLATGDGTARLGAGYARLAEQQLKAGDYQQARRLVTTGLEIAGGDARLGQLRTDIDRATLQTDITRWFRGESEQPAASVGALIQRYRGMAPDDLKQNEAVWAAAAARRLEGLKNNRELYNRTLLDARSLLDDDGPLTRLAEIPPPARAPVPAKDVEVDVPAVVEPPPRPVLALSDLMGRWCADDIQIKFEPKRMVFTLSGGNADYRVNRYDVADDLIQVNWEDRRLGSMVFEFGQFTDSKDKMVQVRGRRSDATTWQSYNRNFLRCG